MRQHPICASVVLSSSLPDCLGRVCRIKAKAAAGRFASLDIAATGGEIAAIEEDGEEQGMGSA